MLYLGRCNVINDDSSIHLVAPTNIHVMPKGCFPIKEITCGRGFACNYRKHFGHICATYTNDVYFLIYGCLQGHMKCLLSLSNFYEAIGSPNMWCLFVCWLVCSMAHKLWMFINIFPFKYFFLVDVKDERYNLQTYGIFKNFMNLSHKYLSCCSHFKSFIMGMHYPRFPSMLV
jgi:hypothetical protein